MRPEDLFLRCYAYQRRDGSWYAVCIDLNLDAEAPSLNAVRASLEHAITGYLQTVLETGDKESLLHLIRRPAPTKDFVRYHTIKTFKRAARFIRSCVTFQEPVPMQLVLPSCA